jgi:SAM-dependent methyltransferase
LLAELCQQDFLATGVELSPTMLGRANVNLAGAGYPGRLVGADARWLPFAAESFDSAILTFPTPIVRDVALWVELARIVRPGGRVVVVLGARTGRVRDGTIVDLVAKVVGRTVGASGLASAADPSRSELDLPVPTESFQTRVVEVEVQRSLVTLVIATKATEARDPVKVRWQ